MRSVSKNYAKGLIEVAEEKGMIDNYGDDLEQMAYLMDKSMEFRNVMFSPAISIKEKENIYLDVMHAIDRDNVIHREVVDFALLLIEKGRLRNIGEIYREYRTIADEIQGRVVAEIISAKELSGNEVAKIKNTIEKAIRKSVTEKLSVDNALIGGITVKIGNVAYDNTVKRKLQVCRSALME